MDAKIYQEAIEYELLTQAVYQAILAKEGINTIDVKHDVSLTGRSGVDHQIDVYWEFKQAGVIHKVLIECKNFASNIPLEKSRNFFAVLHDIGNCNGIMVTKTGYQSGTYKFCKHYGIALKLLKKPVPRDWEGRVREIRVKLIPRVPISNDKYPITMQTFLSPKDEEQSQRLKAAFAKNPQFNQTGPSLRFLDSEGEPNTDEMRWWIPRQLNVLKQEDGGPYKQKIELKNHYIKADLGVGEELIRVIGVVITYYVETLGSDEIIINGLETVEAVLTDFESGELEHAHRNT